MFQTCSRAVAADLSELETDFSVLDLVVLAETFAVGTIRMVPAANK